MCEIEVTEEITPISLAAHQFGAHVLLRHRGRPIERLWLSRIRHGGFISGEKIRRMVVEATDARTTTLAIEEELLGEPPPAPPPSLTVAVCTRGRPELLRRCLAALVAMRDARQGTPIDLLVVDNAPDDDRTRRAAEAFQSVRYAIEPIPGLDFGRNRALAETGRDWLAFVDDDAVVDPGWLDALAEGVRDSPSAAAFTGPVLPLMLDTEAQLRFEMSGGFGKGFAWERYGPERWDDPIYPSAAGDLGTGAGMAFSTEALRALGGFDEALDTGPPLPGGGDVDMFYRVVRSGRRLVYLPGLAVHHEHRRDMTSLSGQYHSWGLAITALVRKNAATDPAMRGRHGLLLLLYSASALRRLLGALAGRGYLPPGLVWAEIWGGMLGYFGEYERSQRRIDLRKRMHQA